MLASPPQSSASDKLKRGFKAELHASLCPSSGVRAHEFLRVLFDVGLFWKAVRMCNVVGLRRVSSTAKRVHFTQLS